MKQTWHSLSIIIIIIIIIAIIIGLLSSHVNKYPLNCVELLLSTFLGSISKECSLTDKALLINGSAKRFLTMQR
jgi:hypothetical protein